MTTTTLTRPEIRALRNEALAANDPETAALAGRALGMTVAELYAAGCNGFGYEEIADFLRLPSGRVMDAARARLVIARV
jgi:DNA-directed RNA polymerase specialized sigma24 family protein